MSNKVLTLILFLMVGVITFFITQGDSQRDKHFDQWTKTEGTVVGSERRSEYINRATRYYSVPVIEYRVDGKRYRTYGTRSDLSDGSASTITVAYNPDKHSEAVSEPTGKEHQWSNFLRLLSYASFGIVLICLVLMVRDYRRKT